VFRNPATKVWEDDFRRAGVPRLHLSYGVTKKPEADRLRAVVVDLFRSRQYGLLERLRAGTVTVHQLAELRTAGASYTTLDPVEPWPTMGVAVAEYLAGLANNPKKSARTAEMADSQLRRFLAVVGAGTRMDAVTSKQVTAYQKQLIDEGAKPNTVTAYVARVGAVYRWHRRRDEREALEQKRTPRRLHVPLDPETIGTAQTRRDRYLSKPEAERLLAATPQRLLFPVMAGLFAGLRIDEMAHLRTAFDVDLRLNLLSIQEQPEWRPKTKRSRRHVPIAAPLRPVLEHHLAHYASEEWVTPAATGEGTRPLSLDMFYTHFRAIVERADLVYGRGTPKGVTYHTLRHTFASWLVERSIDLYTVSQLLGNRVEEVERTYAHLSPDFRKKAVDALRGAVQVPEIRDEPPQRLPASEARE
jgi:integrase